MTCSLVKDASGAGGPCERGLQISTGQFNAAEPERDSVWPWVRPSSAVKLPVTEKVFCSPVVSFTDCSDSRRRKER